MKVLLIDDDEAIRTVFSTALQQAGFTTIEAADGKTGLEKAKSESPNLILLDQIMPDMTGNEVLKALKADATTKEIPVVLLSNFGQNELVEEALQSGALDYILKYQVESKDLIAKINSLTSGKNPGTQINSSNET